MSEKMIIPDEYQGSMKRLLNRMPLELRDDESLLQTLLIYLKIGGEKLARHRIEVAKKIFPDQMVLIKKQLRDGIDDEEDAEGETPEADKDVELAAESDKPLKDSVEYS